MTRQPHPGMSRAYLNWLAEINGKREKTWLSPWVEPPSAIEPIKLFQEEPEPDTSGDRLRRLFK